MVTRVKPRSGYGSIIEGPHGLCLCHRMPPIGRRRAPAPDKGCSLEILFGENTPKRSREHKADVRRWGALQRPTRTSACNPVSARPHGRAHRRSSIITLDLTRQAAPDIAIQSTDVLPRLYALKRHRTPMRPCHISSFHVTTTLSCASVRSVSLSCRSPPAEEVSSCDQTDRHPRSTRSQHPH